MSNLQSRTSAGTALCNRKPLIAHVLHRFDYGGLENGLVNLINRLPEEQFRHCVIALTEATDYQLRLRRPDVEVHALGKKPGKDFGAYLRLVRLLRRLRPSVLHTRNVGTLDCAVLGRLAGIPACVHGEHGWDTHDPEGKRLKYRYLRRAANPCVDRFIVVSSELQSWLIDRVGIQREKVVHICNGVDTKHFEPAACRMRVGDLGARFGKDGVIVGSVMRFEEIKDPLNLVEAFLRSRKTAMDHGVKLRLAIIGDGQLRGAAQERVAQSGAADAVWMPGSRDDIPELLRAMDIFALPSQREGISNTLLEAMAAGLPLVATDTGGNSELVRVGSNGMLVPPGDPELLADALTMLAVDETSRQTFGRASRAMATENFSIDRMVGAYQQLYEELTSGPGTERTCVA